MHTKLNRARLMQLREVRNKKHAISVAASHKNIDTAHYLRIGFHYAVRFTAPCFNEETSARRHVPFTISTA